MMRPMRRGGFLGIGLFVLGLFAWEMIWQGNHRRWQVWLLLVPGTAWTYAGVQRFAGDSVLHTVGDPSGWVVLLYLLGPLMMIPYLLLRIEEHIAGR